jgi:hypothetical protein
LAKSLARSGKAKRAAATSWPQYDIRLRRNALNDAMRIAHSVHAAAGATHTLNTDVAMHSRYAVCSLFAHRIILGHDRLFGKSGAFLSLTCHSQIRFVSLVPCQAPAEAALIISSSILRASPAFLLFAKREASLPSSFGDMDSATNLIF